MAYTPQSQPFVCMAIGHFAKLHLDGFLLCLWLTLASVNYYRVGFLFHFALPYLEDQVTCSMALFGRRFHTFSRHRKAGENGLAHMYQKGQVVPHWILLTQVVEHCLHAGKCSQPKGLKVLLRIAPVKHLRLNLWLFNCTVQPLIRWRQVMGFG